MFVVISSRNIPNHLHGYLSRFLAEVDTGVYVGNVSRRVRDNLWKRCAEAIKEGSLTIINEDHTREQGFAVNTLGPQCRIIKDMDGLLLACTFSSAKSEDDLSGV